MRTLFTIHAGEFLVGSEIGKNIDKANIWIPSKDKGIDLLVTNSNNDRLASIQVKFSRDFLVTHMDEMFQRGLLACGWWTHNLKKIQQSIADLWIFVLQAFNIDKTQYIIISPQELEHRLTLIHGVKERLHSYFWVTKDRKCWETRGLSKKDQILIANKAFSNRERNFSDCLNAWEKLAVKIN